jgi:hypothetical protein
MRGCGRDRGNAAAQVICTCDPKANLVLKRLSFAEHVLTNAAGLWEQASLKQKQRLQQICFPGIRCSLERVSNRGILFGL